MRKWVFMMAVVAALATIAVFVAVGKGTIGLGNSSAKRLSKIDWEGGANLACNEYRSQESTVARPVTLLDVPDRMQQEQKLLQRLIDRLRSLNPPARTERAVERMIQLREQELAQAGRALAAAKAYDRRAVSAAVQDASSASVRSQIIARRLGANVCAIT
ncbi:MAG: hypothetical protein ACXVZP_07380 [Gaiellaceae bacterium]